ncbi:MAG: DUF1854 domain-containing protein, partial [Bacteroidales bacterium]|nr:DUF1854 domain-containing protein [Bacteroidales bacterium]
AQGRLVLTLPDGTRHVGVEPVRAFPISDPRGPVSLLDADGRELFTTARLEELPMPLRSVIERELSQRHFLPVITEVIGLTGQVEPIACEVQTDHGPVRFRIKAEEDVRRLPGGRVLITDEHGVRYLIPNIDKLDSASRRRLVRYL